MMRTTSSSLKANLGSRGWNRLRSLASLENVTALLLTSLLDEDSGQGRHISLLILMPTRGSQPLAMQPSGLVALTWESGERGHNRGGGGVSSSSWLRILTRDRFSSWRRSRREKRRRVSIGVNEDEGGLPGP